MFTLDQIKALHAKVKSGADFPQYVREIGAIGVTHYDLYVTDGSTHYRGKDEEKVTDSGMGAPRKIAANSSVVKLQDALRIHQQGQTDYPTFCTQAADAGWKNGPLIWQR